MTPVPPGTRPVVVLVGPPGSGKSTVSRHLADLLGLAQRDTDTDVETAAGKPVADIFVDHGEPHFRELEREAVTTALATHDGVLALGGGAVLDEHTQTALAAYVASGGAVVFLDVSLAHAAPRVGLNQSRPLLLGNPRARWVALMEARRPVYERVATLHVVTDARTPAQVAQEIRAHLAGGGGAADRAAAPAPADTPAEQENA
ncbi:shikimate kinase [Cellulosimicrobium sp. SH8]|uniref:shikimate kinase n=1 Tax=Cellulosimicrobium sp. SH8 TaxID=2952936 RepID=UPI0021F2E1DB|nr:shikimate kinase [Cellulosimicrobium sp. SH8]